MERLFISLSHLQHSDTVAVKDSLPEPPNPPTQQTVAQGEITFKARYTTHQPNHVSKVAAAPLHSDKPTAVLLYYCTFILLLLLSQGSLVTALEPVTLTMWSVQYGCTTVRPTFLENFTNIIKGGNKT